MDNILAAVQKAENQDQVVLLKDACINNGEYTTPFPIGYKVLDDAIRGGVREGELITIAGKSGEGKSSCAMNIGLNLIEKGHKIIYFSYELLLDNLYAKFKEMGADLDNLFVYTPKKNTTGKLDWVSEKIKEGLEKYNTKFIFIDDLNALTPSKSGSSSDQRRIIITDICQELKDLAKDLKITIFLMSQVKKVQGREIELDDLAESKGAGNISDFVIAVYRNFEKKKLSDGRTILLMIDETTIKTLKNRIGGKQVYMRFVMKNNRISPVYDFEEMSNAIAAGENDPITKQVNDIFGTTN